VPGELGLAEILTILLFAHFGGSERQRTGPLRAQGEQECLSHRRQELLSYPKFGADSFSYAAARLLCCWDDDWLGGFAPAFHFDYAVGACCARHHSGGVEWRGDVALMVERDHAAVAVLLD
jgi:hypothetical protein